MANPETCFAHVPTMENFSVDVLDYGDLPTDGICYAVIDGPDGPKEIKMEDGGDGTFIGKYPALNSTPGDYEMTAMVDNQPVGKFLATSTDGSDKLKVKRLAKPENCLALIPTMTKFPIQALGYDKQPVDVDDGNCTAEIIGPDGAAIEVKVEDDGNGAFTANYAPLNSVPGDYVMTAMIDHQPVGRYLVTSTDGSDKLKIKKIANPTKSRAQAPTCDEFSIQVSDYDCLPTDGTCTALIDGPDGVVEVDMEDGGDGTFTAKYDSLTSVPGDYVMTAMVNSLPVGKFVATSTKGSDKLKVKKMANPDTCLAHVPTMTKFPVQALGYDKEPVDGICTVEIVGPEGPIEVEVVDDGNGAFTANYAPLNSVPGDYMMTAMIDHQPVGRYLAKSTGGSDELQIKKIANPDKCHAQIPTTECPVQPLDYDCTTTDGNCTFEIDGPDGLVETKVEDVDDGSYVAKYAPLNSAPGDYLMTAMVNSQPVGKFLVTSTNGSDKLKVKKMANPDTCFAHVPKMENLSVDVLDHDGLTTEGDCYAIIDGPDGSTEVKMEDGGDGTFIAKYPALNSAPGDYVMTTVVDNQPVGKYRVTSTDGSDKLKVQKMSNPENCLALVPTMTKFPVQALDYDKQPVDGICTVEIVGPDGPIEVKVEDDGNGAFIANYAPLNSVPGDYMMTAMIDHQPVGKYLVKSTNGSDKLKIKKIASPLNSCAQTPTCDEFPIQVLDYDGIPTNGACSAVIDGPEGPIEVTIEDGDDGTAIAKYPALNSVPGDYVITSMVDNQPVGKFLATSTPGSDQLKVKKMANPEACLAHVPTIDCLPVQVLGYDGQPCNGVCKVVIDGPDGPVEVKMEDGGDGTFNAKYAPLNSVPGEYVMTAMVDDQPVGKFVATSTPGSDQLKVKKMAKPDACLTHVPTIDCLPVQVLGYDGQPCDGVCKVVIDGPDGPVEVKMEDGGDGCFNAKYAPLNSVPGDYTMTTLVDNQPISKLAVTSTGDSDKLKIKTLDKPDACGAPTKKKTLPGISEFAFDIPDYQGGLCTMSIEGPDGPIKVDVEDVGDGTFLAKYAPLNSVPGDYVMTVMVDGKPMAKYLVKSTDDSDKISVKSMANPDKCSTKEPTMNDFAVHVVDSDGQPTDGLCTVEIDGPDGPVKVEMVDGGNGTYHAKYAPLNSVPGDYITTAKVDGKTVGKYLVKSTDGSDKLTVKSIANPDKCFAKEPNLEDLVVHVVDSDGKPTEGICTVEIIGPDGPVDVDVVDCGDGTFQAKYAPLNSVPGDYVMTAMVDSEPVAKYSVQSSPNSTDLKVKKLPNPKLCGVNGPGLDKLTVCAIDYDGQPVDGLCTVDIIGPDGPVEVEVEDCGNGKYNATYEPLNSVPGDYVISTMIDGNPIAKYRVTSTPNSDKLETVNLADIDQCFIKGPGLKELMIYTRDFNGQPTNGVCTVELTGPDGPVEVKIEDVACGTYRAKYAPLNAVPGDYTLEAMVDSAPVGKFRITTVPDSNELTVNKMISPKQCFVDGPGMEGLDVFLRDHNGKPTNGVCTVNMKGPDGPIEVKVDDVGNGTFHAQYPPLNKQPGDYLIEVMADFQTICKFVVHSIPESNKLTIKSAPDPKQCAIQGPGMEKLIVYVRDHNGMPTDGDCKVELKGPDGPVEVKLENTAKGTFLATYPALNKKEGLYMMQILVDTFKIAKFNIKAVKGSPKLDFTNVASTGQCFIKNVGPEELTVYIRGANGQPAEGECTVEIEGPKGPVEVKVQDIGDGTYVAKYDPLNKIIGEYKVQVLIDGDLITKARINCVKGNKFEVKNVADIKQCFVKGPCLDELVVYVRDHDGKPTDGTCLVDIKGPSGAIETKVEKTGDGTYQVKYAPLNLESGDYIMEVMVDFNKIAKYRIKTVAGSSKLSISEMADTKQCYIEGPSPEKLTVYVRGFDGTPTKGDCSVEIKSPNGYSFVGNQCNETNDFKYPALNAQSGDYAMEIKVDSEYIARFNIKVQQGKLNIMNIVDARNCFVEGPGLEELMIYVRGVNGQPAAGDCTVEIKGPDGIMNTQVDNVNDGTYKAKYKALNSKAGDYFIDVKVNKELVSKFYAKAIENSSRLKVICVADYKRCFVKGPSVDELMVYVIGFDGKPADGMCKVHLTGPDGKKLGVKIAEAGLGTFQVKYASLNEVPGVYIMEVVIDFEKIRKFHITTIPGSSKLNIRCMANAKGCSIQSPSPEQVTVLIRGFDGAPAEGEVTAEIEGPNGSVEITEVENAGNGTYYVKYAPLNKEPGTYMFTIMVDSEIVQKFRMNVVSESSSGGGGGGGGGGRKSFDQAADLKQCLIEGPGLENVTVHIRGANGEPADGNCGAQVTGPDGKKLRVSIERAGDAVFRLKYPSLNSQTGRWGILVAVNNQPIAKFCVNTTEGSTEFDVRPQADPRQCTIQGVSDTKLTVFTKDLDGKPTNSDCTVAIEGPDGEIVGEVESTETGTFVAKYPSFNKKPGDYVIKVQVDGQSIGQYRIKVQAAPG